MICNSVSPKQQFISTSSANWGKDRQAAYVKLQQLNFNETGKHKDKKKKEKKKFIKDAMFGLTSRESVASLIILSQPLKVATWKRER